MMRRHADPTGRDQDEQGFTLVELLVSMTIFAVLMAMVTGAVLSNARAVDNAKQLDDINEEARLALLRMERELRQAQVVNAADLFTTGAAGTAGWARSITFSDDFNGDGVIQAVASDPETLTYRYLPDASGNGQIQLTADDASGTAVDRPILSGHVSDFHLELRSSQYSCDANGDGITTWQELDTSTQAACPHPNNNGLDANELNQIDSVFVTFSVFEGSHKQTYSSQVNLRNVGVGALT
ncbi:MAG: type II secretion system protein [Pseudorhodobacter sp.]|nr:type II secretion system protein [Frankiaceae bacterium]